MYNLPVLLSGLSSLPIRPSNTKSLAVFHNKSMRGFLKLSNSSPIPALHFLLGELPAEAHLHIDALTLFHNAWVNSDTTVHELVKYILRMCSSTSTTWSNHIQLLCQKYGLPSPLFLLENVPAWPKEKWKCLVKTRVTVFFEKKLRMDAARNSKMNYLNVQLSGLTGRPHPSLLGILTTQDTRKLRLHTKLLVGDFLTAEQLAHDQPNLSSACSLCQAPSPGETQVESTTHVLVLCRSTSDVRERIFPELMNIVFQVQPNSRILDNPTPAVLTQFILDCTSINLDEDIRIPAHNPNITSVYKVCRDWSYAVTNERARLLKKICKDDSRWHSLWQNRS